MAATRQSIPDVPYALPEGHRKFLNAVKETIEIITGRRKNKASRAANATAKAAVGANPTKAEHDALLHDVNELRIRLNAFIDRQDA